MNLLEKQNAIQEALQSLLNDAQLDKAMQIWRLKHADKPAFALQHFVRECCASLSLPEKRSEMLQCLVQKLTALQMRIRESADVPVRTEPVAADPAFKQEPLPSISGQETKVGASAVPGLNGALQVFQMVIENICSDSGREASIGIRTSLVNNLAPLRLTQGTRAAIENWLFGREKALGIVDVPLSAMQRMVNLAYVGLCEACGPVKADAILDNAVRRAARTATACNFDPVRLL